MRFNIPSRKRPFLLLETLLAVAMIGLCSTYLIATPIKIYRRHLEDLKKIELGRIADTLFIQIQYSLTEKHPWDSFNSKTEHVYSLEPLCLRVGSVLNTTYQCGYTLREKKSKEGRNHIIYKLVECVLYMTPSHKDFSWENTPSSHIYTYPYLIFTSATPKNPT